MEVIAQGYNWYYSESSEVFHEKGDIECLMYIFHSPVTVKTEKHTWHVDEGDILFLEQGEMHTVSADHCSFMLDWVIFSMNEDDRNTVRQLNIPFNKVMRTSNGFILSNLVLYCGFISELEKGKHDKTREQLFLSLLYCVSSLIQNFNVKDDTEKKYPEMTKLRLEIYANPQEDWTIERMCSITHRSASGLHQLYRKLFGISCTEDVIAARINLAQYLLRSNKLSVTEIAFKCGYNSYTHFARQFKLRTGITPAEYRETYTLKL